MSATSLGQWLPYVLIGVGFILVLVALLGIFVFSKREPADSRRYGIQYVPEDQVGTTRPTGASGSAPFIEGYPPPQPGVPGGFQPQYPQAPPVPPGYQQQYPPPPPPGYPPQQAGGAQTIPAQPVQRTCYNCGNLIPPNHAGFCPQCGARLT